MSDETPLPPVDPAVQEFLWSHAETGEPDGRELARVRARLFRGESTRIVQLVPASPVPARRRLLAPEVMAVAAVLVVSLVGGAGAYLFRAREEVAPPAAPAAPLPPPAVVPEVAQAETVSDIVARGTQPDDVDVKAIDDVGRLLELGRARQKRGDLTGAITALSRCLTIDPPSPDCTVMLASAYARRGAQDSSQQDNDRARVLYEEFLGLAPPDDRRIPRVRAILSGDTSSRGTPPAGQSMLKAGRDAEAHSPQAARRWYQAVIEYAPESEAADEARDRLGALAQAQGAARLTKITSSPIGAEIIVDGERTGRRTPVLPRSPLEVTPGRHVIEFEFNGRRSRPLEIDASPGDNATVLRAEIPLADEAGAALPPEGAPLVLARGAVRTLRLDGIITRVAVGDASVADGRTVGRSTVVVFGLQRGRTTVMVWTETGQQSFLVEVR